jgi:hypothetical protein
MHPTTLHPGPEQHGAHGLGQPEVCVGDHESHSTQAAGLQAAQERGPERAVLAVTDIHAQHFAVPIAAHPNRDDHGLGDDLVIDACLAVGRVQEHIREARGLQRPAAERGHLIVQVGADPRHLALGDPRRDSEGLDQVVNLAGRHPVQVGLHDHREQGLIHPATPIQQGREERTGAQLRDPQPQITSGRGHGAGS